MSYLEVVCGDCGSDLECPKCRPTDTVVCHVCSCEVSVPWRVKPETVDLDAVAALLRCIAAADYSSLQWQADLDQLAHEVQISVRP